MSEIQKRLGKKISEFRKKRDLSQEELAFKSGLHRTYISDVERGSRNISIKNIEKISKALGISAAELLD